MNDHIESLQIDLNSIKEFLSNNSFNNQIDTYTINNVSVDYISIFQFLLFSCFLHFLRS